MSKTTTDDWITEVKRLKKTIRNTRLSSILFVAALLICAVLDLPLQIFAPIFIVAAIAMVIFIGLPAQKKYAALKMEILLSDEVEANE